MGSSKSTELVKVARKMARNSLVQPSHKAKRTYQGRVQKRCGPVPDKEGNELLRMCCAHTFAPDQDLICLEGLPGSAG